MEKNNRRFPVDLRRSRTANGGWEWYFCLGNQRIYAHGPDGVGVFTEPDVGAEEAFRRVLQQWNKVI
jgi:hypothetical protein